MSDARRTAEDARQGLIAEYPPEDFGKEFLLGFDVDGYERRDCVCAVAVCPTCNKDVALVADTEEWTEADDGRWEHSGYGPATGVCCDNLIVDSWDGCDVYKMPRRQATEAGGE